MKLYRKNRKLNNSGFSLVEVLVAIVILAIISLPVLSTFSNAARINNKARRTENANTAINNIIEEAKSMSLDRLAGGNGQYTYQQLGGIDSTTYSVGNKKDASNILYYEGVNKEKFYIQHLLTVRLRIILIIILILQEYQYMQMFQLTVHSFIVMITVIIRQSHILNIIQVSRHSTGLRLLRVHLLMLM